MYKSKENISVEDMWYLNKVMNDITLINSWLNTSINITDTNTWEVETWNKNQINSTWGIDKNNNII